MKNSSLDEVGKYNEITSPEHVEGKEVLNSVLQKRKGKGKKKRKKKSRRKKHEMKIHWKM